MHATSCCTDSHPLKHPFGILSIFNSTKTDVAMITLASITRAVFFEANSFVAIRSLSSKSAACTSLGVHSTEMQNQPRTELPTFIAPPFPSHAPTRRLIAVYTGASTHACCNDSIGCLIASVALAMGLVCAGTLANSRQETWSASYSTPPTTPSPSSCKVQRKSGYAQNVDFLYRL